MKRYCKNIDICDIDYIFDFVYDCCNRHKRRTDFKRLFFSHGMTRRLYKIMIDTNNYMLLKQVVIEICKDAIQQIQAQNLNLPPVVITEKIDKTTQKVRQIGRESAMQQIFDYIAVYSAKAIWDARIVPQQCSSIVGRGQLYGVRQIRRMIKQDANSERYAKKHNRHYSRKHKYFCKLDIQKCFPTANTDIFLNLFEKDCANKQLMWLWRTLISTHKVDDYTGFMIGALPSQWAAQYMVSYIYRFAKDLHYINKGKQFKSVQGMIIFMDDILVTGSNRKQLLRAINNIVKYTKDTLGWNIKPTWHIRDINNCSIDMMGYVVHKTGRISIRARNFIKMRRLALRIENNNYIPTFHQSKRMASYKGYYKYSNNSKISKKYKFTKVFDICGQVVSEYSKKQKERICYGSN